MRPQGHGGSASFSRSPTPSPGPVLTAARPSSLYSPRKRWWGCPRGVLPSAPTDRLASPRLRVSRGQSHGRGGATRGGPRNVGPAKGVRGPRAARGAERRSARWDRGGGGGGSAGASRVETHFSGPRPPFNGRCTVFLRDKRPLHQDTGRHAVAERGRVARGSAGVSRGARETRSRVASRRRRRGGRSRGAEDSRRPDPIRRREGRGGAVGPTTRGALGPRVCLGSGCSGPCPRRRARSGGAGPRRQTLRSPGTVGGRTSDTSVCPYTVGTRLSDGTKSVPAGQR